MQEITFQNIFVHISLVLKRICKNASPVTLRPMDDVWNYADCKQWFYKNNYLDRSSTKFHSYLIIINSLSIIIFICIQAY